jgi:hypothetical protein
LASLVIAVTIAVGIAFVVALAYHLTGATWHRAIVIVFLLGGAGLTAFALMTSRADQMRSSVFDFATELVSWGPKDERMTLNPTGVLAVAGIVIAALGLVFDAVAR